MPSVNESTVVRALQELNNEEISLFRADSRASVREWQGPGMDTSNLKGHKW